MKSFQLTHDTIPCNWETNQRDDDDDDDDENYDDDDDENEHDDKTEICKGY